MCPIGEAMTNFQKTLVALTSIRNSIERAALCLYAVNGSNLSDKPDRVSDPFLLFTLQNYLLILLCSFLDEWRRFSSFAKNDARVIQANKIVKPAMDRFQRWPHLHKIRSGMLAHSPNNSGEMIFPWEAFAKYRCPTTLEEILLLAFCSLMAVDHVKDRFAEDQAEAEKEILNMDRAIKAQGVPNTAQLESEFAAIQEQISGLKKQQGHT